MEYEGIIYQSSNGELKHWGIKGQRWGVRRYQNPDGSLTALGKKRRGIEDDPAKEKYEAKKEKLEAKRAKVIEKQVEKARKDELKNIKNDISARKESLKNKDNYDLSRSDEKLREKLLNSSDAAEIFKNRHLLTTAELKDRINRIETERQLQDKTGAKKTDLATKLDKIANTGKKVNEVYKMAKESPILKDTLKKLGIESDKLPTIEEFMNNPDKYGVDTAKAIMTKVTAVGSAVRNMKDADSYLGRRSPAKKAEEEAAKNQKDFDDYAEKLKRDQEEADSKARGEANANMHRKMNEDRKNQRYEENLKRTTVQGYLNAPSEPKKKWFDFVNDDRPNRGTIYYDVPYTEVNDSESTSSGRSFMSGLGASSKSSRLLSPANISSINSMRNSGKTVEEIADRFNVSPATISSYSLGSSYIAGLLPPSTR